MTIIHSEATAPTETRAIMSAGVWLVRKARAQQATSGTYAAARNLRKQAVPLHLALAILRRPA